MRARVLAMLLCGSLASLAAVLPAAPQQKGGNPEAAKLKNPVAADTDGLAAGETLFRRRCAGCHGVDATGGPPKDAGDAPAANLVDDTWDHGGTDGEIFTIIRDGIGPEYRMEPFGDRLNDRETWQVINYMRSLAKNKK